MNFMKYKLYFFVFSLVIILPGLYYLFTSGLKLGIDFTGGAILEYKLESRVDNEELKKVISDQGVEVAHVTNSGENTYVIKTKPLEQEKITQIKNSLAEKFGNVEERRVENVGPVIGNELKIKAL